MADGTRLNAGAGGDLLATDDDGTYKHQYVKLEYGPDNTYTKVTKTTPVPVGGNLAADGSGNLVPFLVDAAGHTQIDVITAPITVVTNTVLSVVGNGAAATAQRVTLASDSTGIITVTAVPAPLNVVGGGTEAAALRVTIANDSTGVITVDGTVAVSAVIPGVGATNLGKAEDAAHTTGDVGVMLLGVRQDNASTLVDTDGDYTAFSASDHGCMNVDPQHYYELDSCDVTTGWSALNDDAGNITTDLNHVMGTASLEFDKLNGGSNTTLAVVQKTITSFSANKFMEEGGGFLLWSMYLSSLALVDYVFIRLGTDSTNYNEWRVQDDDLTAAVWNNLRAPMTGPSDSVGNGWNSAAVVYLAIGVAFDNQANELADILVDSIMMNSGLQTSSDITSQVSTSIANPNVNVKKWGATNVTTNEGTFDAGTLRITQATDDDGVAHLNTIAGDTTSLDTKIVVGGGAEAGAVLVTLANDSTGLVSVDDNGGTLTVDCLSEVVLGTATYTETTSRGLFVAAVRNDDLAALAGTDNEAAPLQVNAAGALYTTEAPATVLRFSVVADTGDYTLIAADASYKFRILSLALFATSGTVTNIYIHNDDNDLLGNTGNRISLDKDGGDGAAGLVLPRNVDGWFETDTVNQALEIDLSAAQDVIAIGTYIKVA